MCMYLHRYYVKCETQVCINFLAGLLAGETHYTCHSAWQEELYSDTAINCGMYGDGLKSERSHRQYRPERSHTQYRPERSHTQCRSER
jgi:hypothetical protein